MKAYRINEDLYDIRLDFEQTNFRNFLSVWVYKGKDICFLVDCGPTSTIKSLIKGLANIGIKDEDLDYILLTHVHMDHAGGVGDLLSYFSRAKVICHPTGIKHLVNPERLWEGSKKALGVIAEMYGKIKPVPEDRISFQETIANNKVRVLETLGHAPHHQSYLFDQYLFVGEAAGTHQPLPENFYIRPATPPIFDYDTWKTSIQKLLSENLKDHKICYPHLGMSENAEKMLKLAQEQLSIWIRVIKDFYDIKERPDFIEEFLSKLKKKDTYFANYELLDKDTKKRELIYTGNSIRGILGYIQKKREKNKN